MNPGEPRRTAATREIVIAFLACQCGDWRNPGPLYAWMVRPETAYHFGPGNHWPCESFAYAAGWQLNRTKADLLDTLGAFQADTTNRKT